MPARSLSDAWEARAAEWAAWARTPGHDELFWRMNWPAFKRLLPAPGRATLDIGCGEGRVGRELARLGYRVTGVDSSPALAALAREAGGYVEVVTTSAVALPFADGVFDLAVAFMSLHDMDDPAAAAAEAARVLGDGGLLCVAMVHPLNRPPEVLEDYFASRRVAEAIERNGLPMTFEEGVRPLETYAAAITDAGFAIEELREPRPDASDEDSELLAKARRRPYFLHLRCRLRG
jgi:SAM-dependent methyltransferase